MDGSYVGFESFTGLTVFFHSISWDRSGRVSVGHFHPGALASSTFLSPASSSASVSFLKTAVTSSQVSALAILSFPSRVLNRSGDYRVGASCGSAPRAECAVLSHCGNSARRARRAPPSAAAFVGMEATFRATAQERGAENRAERLAAPPNNHGNVRQVRLLHDRALLVPVVLRRVPIDPRRLRRRAARSAPRRGRVPQYWPVFRGAPGRQQLAARGDLVAQSRHESDAAASWNRFNDLVEWASRPPDVCAAQVEQRPIFGL